MVSSDIVNNGPGDLVVVVPVTSTDYGLRSHVEIPLGVSGLEHASYARCDHIRVVSTARIRNRRGEVAPDELSAIERALRFILDLRAPDTEPDVLTPLQSPSPAPEVLICAPPSR